MALTGVLRTRLVPPRVHGEVVPRPALVARVLAGLSGRLVAVVAGAGYGKTTLLAQALPALERPWVWCSLDGRMGLARQLLAHLAVGLGERVPGFGATLRLEGSVQDQVDELANEVLDTLPDDVVLLLDDVHALAGTEAEGALGLLVQDLPPTVHLVMASRTSLPFSISRLRGMRRAVEISEADLGLSEEEAARLLAAEGSGIPAERVAELYRRSEGWAAGLVLAARAESSRSSPWGPERERGLFDYLADEVFLRQPPDIQEFLIATSVFERFTPRLAEAVTEGVEAAAIARRLVRDHLFTVRLAGEGEWYRYHHLFQAFLRRRLAERDPERVAAIHRLAAPQCLSAGQPVEAVRHYLEAGDLPAAVDALEPIAEEMVTSPEVATLIGWLEGIPVELWAGRPGLVLAHASILFAKPDFDAAFSALERAVRELVGLGDHQRAVVALFRLIGAVEMAGRPERAVRSGRRMIGELDPETPLLAEAKLRLAALACYACRYEEVPGELEAAVARGGSSALGAYARIVRGFYLERPTRGPAAGLATLEGGIADLERREADDVLAYLPWARSYRGILLDDLGRYEEALAEVPRFEAACERFGIGGAVGPPRAWLQLQALIGLGRWREAEAELRSSARLFSPALTQGYDFRFHLGAARLAVHRGDQATAEAEILLARDKIRRYGAGFDGTTVTCDLADVAVDAELGELARDLADEALASPATARSPWAAARSALAGAVAHEPGARGDALLEEALVRSQDAEVAELWTRRERRRAAGLLSRALQARIGPPGVAARLLTACGGDVLAECAERLRLAPPEVRAELAAIAGDAPAVDATIVVALAREREPEVRAAAERSLRRLAARPRPALRFVTLGGFSVLRAGVALSDAAFGRRRARSLLAALLCARRAVHRDVLIDWFWADLSPRRALAALNTTLYELRRALEPGLIRGRPSALVLSEGETYRLALSPDDAWDAAEFLRLAAEAAQADGPEERVARLMSAEDAYAGPLLPDWTYEDWTRDLRVEVDEAQRSVSADLAAAFVEAGRPADAVPRYRRLLALEPEREAWHRGLMRAYARSGELGLALRQYHACRAVLRRELGVEPGDETRALFRALLAGWDGVAGPEPRGAVP